MYLGHKPLNQVTKNVHVIDFLTHADEPRDKYDEYLSGGAEPRDSVSNSRNIFDDSNIEDRKWFETVKKHLSRVG